MCSRHGSRGFSARSSRAMRRSIVPAPAPRFSAASAAAFQRALALSVLRVLACWAPRRAHSRRLVAVASSRWRSSS